MIIDHFGIGVGDYARARTFYTEALRPLGITLVMEVDQPHQPGKACGFGRDGKPDFWLGSEGKTTPPAHVAFVAESRAAVRAFYDAALRAGARENGPPGLRPRYHPDYYAAFVIDLDGHNVEAVCHARE